jgi:3-hydroxyisobutyrate dehydrogenase-like beta-hydroxyacid dehydrogenase
MPEKLRVGYIGVGLMGHGAAANILRNDWPLTILGHRNRAPVDDLVGRGAAEAADIADLAARSDVIFLCLPAGAVVEAVMAGPDGLIATLRPGMVVVDKSTGDPALTRRLGALVAARGAHMIDGPIGRTPREAEAGKLSTLLGGDAGAIARVRPIVASYSDTIIDAGPLGAALTIKIVNNFVSFANAFVIAETFATASKLGLDLASLCAMIEAGGANSTMFQWLLPWIREGDDSRGKGRLSAGGTVLEAYRSLAKDGGAPTVLADAVANLLGQVLGAGHGERSIPMLPGVLAQIAGAPFRPLD